METVFSWVTIDLTLKQFPLITITRNYG